MNRIDRSRLGRASFVGLCRLAKYLNIQMRCWCPQCRSEIEEAVVRALDLLDD